MSSKSVLDATADSNSADSHLRHSSLKQLHLSGISLALVEVPGQPNFCKNGWAHLSVLGDEDYATTLVAAQKNQEEESLPEGPD